LWNTAVIPQQAFSPVNRNDAEYLDIFCKPIRPWAAVTHRTCAVLATQDRHATDREGMEAAKAGQIPGEVSYKSGCGYAKRLF
jgi:hypothetical protein